MCALVIAGQNSSSGTGPCSATRTGSGTSTSSGPVGSLGGCGWLRGVAHIMKNGLPDVIIGECDDRVMVVPPGVEVQVQDEASRVGVRAWW